MPEFRYDQRVTRSRKENGESFSTFSVSVPRPAFENMNKNKWEQNQFNKNVTVIYLMLGNYEKY